MDKPIQSTIEELKKSKEIWMVGMKLKSMPDWNIKIKAELGATFEKLKRNIVIVGTGWAPFYCVLKKHQ